jgi:mxaJ protein
MRGRGKLLAVLGVAMASMASLGAPPTLAAEQRRELKVCADPNNLPFSNDRLEGFENKIASLIAAHLHASLHYTWQIQRRGFLRKTLHTGLCDLVMGLTAGLPGVSATRPYYTSTYVFVSAKPRNLNLRSFDEPALRSLKIGLHAVGAAGVNPPPAHALASRGIIDNIIGFPMWGEDGVENPQGKVIDAVATGEIDTAIVWGPFGGYFAKRYVDQLVVTPVAPDSSVPSLVFTYDIALGVRQGDEAFKAELQDVLDHRKQDIQAILHDYGIPLVAAAPSDHRALLH